jgi:hypothetical protein
VRDAANERNTATTRQDTMRVIRVLIFPNGESISPRATPDDKKIRPHMWGCEGNGAKMSV